MRLGRELVLATPQPSAEATVNLVGAKQPLPWREPGGKMHIELPVGSGLQADAADAYTFKLTGVR